MRSLIELGRQVANGCKLTHLRGEPNMLQNMLGGWRAGAAQPVRVAPLPHAIPLILQGVGAKTISCVLLFGLGVSGGRAAAGSESGAAGYCKLQQMPQLTFQSLPPLVRSSWAVCLTSYSRSIPLAA